MGGGARLRAIAPMTTIAPSTHGHQTVPSSSVVSSASVAAVPGPLPPPPERSARPAPSPPESVRPVEFRVAALAGVAARRRHHRTDRWERGRDRRTGTAGVGPAGTDQHDDRGNTEQTKSHSGMVVDRPMSSAAHRYRDRPVGGNLGKGPMRSKSSMLAIALLVGAGALSIVPTSPSVDAAPAGFTDTQVGRLDVRIADRGEGTAGRRPARVGKGRSASSVSPATDGQHRRNRATSASCSGSERGLLERRARPIVRHDRDDLHLRHPSRSRAGRAPTRCRSSR